jgi:hypothetical protein
VVESGKKLMSFPYAEAKNITTQIRNSLDSKKAIMWTHSLLVLAQNIMEITNIEKKGQTILNRNLEHIWLLSILK